MKAIQIMSMALILSLSSTVWAQDLATVKAKILSLAQTYAGQADPDGEKAKTFLPLIQELLSYAPPQTMEQKASVAVGAWRQIWGPYFYNNASQVISGLDPNNIYQVISASGIYTNVGVYKFFGAPVVGILKGKYSVSSEKIDVEFVENGILLQKVPQGYSLADLPALKEDGRLCIFEFPSFLPPVGIKGALTEIYVDENLRITYGSQEGESGETLYVLQRVAALKY